MVFILSALWWIRIRGLWKVPDGRDWLWDKLGLAVCGAIHSKSLIQFSADGWACVLSLQFGLRPNYGKGRHNVPLVSLIFWKRSLVFPILLFSSNSLHWSLRNAFLSLLAIFWNSAFKCVYLSFSPLLFTSLLFTAICKASSDSHFAITFLFLGDGLNPCFLFNATNLCP